MHLADFTPEDEQLSVKPEKSHSTPMQQAADFLAHTEAHPSLRYGAFVDHAIEMKSLQNGQLYAPSARHTFNEAFFHLLNPYKFSSDFDRKSPNRLPASVVAMEELYRRLENARTLQEILQCLPRELAGILPDSISPSSHLVNTTIEYLRLRLIKAHSMSMMYKKNAEDKREEIDLARRSGDPEAVIRTILDQLDGEEDQERAMRGLPKKERQYELPHVA